MKKQFLLLACIVGSLSVVCTDQAVAEDKDHKPTIQAEQSGGSSVPP